MALLGNGAMVIWCDSTDPTDHDAWHSHEHLIERVGVPGFLRGRRGVATSGSPRYLVIYEVNDLATLTSAPYLERLNDPRPWTQCIVPTLQNVNRSLCRVTASFGSGIGTWILTLRVSPEPDAVGDLRDWLICEALPNLVAEPGFVSASLLECDQAASQVETEEKRLRETADDIADWIILVDGYDASAVQALPESALSPARLADFGGGTDHAACYQLVHTLTENDVR